MIGPANMTAHAQMCRFCVSQLDGQTFLIAMTSSANVVGKEDMDEAFQDRHPLASTARPASQTRPRCLPAGGCSLRVTRVWYPDPMSALHSLLLIEPR